LNVFLLHRIYVLDALLDDACDLFAGETVNEDNPFINQKLFGFVFNLDSFKHLDRFDDVREHFLSQV
jgi:hypothetical protein